MTMTARVAGNEENDGGKSNGNGKKGDGQAMVTATKRAMVAATRVVGNEEGYGYGREGSGQQRGQ